MDEKVIRCDSAPSFPTIMSQARRAGNLLFLSGLVPMKANDRDVYGDNAAEQTYLVLQNMQAICKSAGATMADVAKTTIFLKDIGDYGAVNAIYRQFFDQPMPARSCVEVSALARKEMLVEIEAVVELPS